MRRLPTAARRDGCCATWPKPCSYHEGWQDALDECSGRRAGEEQGSDPGDGRPRVYVAHALTTYGTVGSRRHLARLGALLPEAEIVDPEGQGWRTNADWREAWPAVLRQLSALVAFGPVGAGMLQEIGDCLFFRVPVAVLHRGELAELAGLALRSPRTRSPRHLAELVPGRQITPATFTRRMVPA